MNKKLLIAGLAMLIFFSAFAFASAQVQPASNDSEEAPVDGGSGLQGVVSAIQWGVPYLQDIIYLICGILLVPVMVFLIVGTLFACFEFGRFTYEFVMRKKYPSRVEEIEISKEEREDIKKATHIIHTKGSTKLVHEFTGDLERLKPKTQRGRVFEMQLEKLMQNYEEKVRKMLEITSILVRVGPMVGLMGTLIPLGPALLALSLGDYETLANSLIIAFGTTVLGLLIGGIAYAITTVRNRWYDHDMDDIAYISEMLFGVGREE